MSKTLVDEIDARAAEESRTRSNWIVHHLRKIIEARKKERKLTILPSAVRVAGPSPDSTAEPALRVAEDPPARPAKRGPRHRSTRGIHEIARRDSGAGSDKPSA